MFDFLWNLHQQSRIGELSSELARVKAAGPDRRLDEIVEHNAALEDRLDKLLLINMAMWSFIEEKLGVTEDRLAERVREIDLRDGTLDGRPPQTAAICEQCNRPMSRRHARCLYCGGQTRQGSPFAGA